MKIQFLALDSYNNVVGLKRLMGSETSPLDNWISNDMYKEMLKNWLPVKKTTYYHTYE